MRSKIPTIFNTKEDKAERQIQLLDNPSEIQVHDRLQEQSTEAIQLVETHKRKEEIHDIETFIELREARVDRSQDNYKELSTDMENKQEDEIGNTTEHIQSGRQTVHIRVEDYEPSFCPFYSSDKSLLPRDLENTVLLEGTKTLSADKDVEEIFL